MAQYREIAQKAMYAHQSGHAEDAAKMARSLEDLWDRSEEELQGRHLETWNAIDQAMDAFIKPLLDYSKGIPDETALNTAYQAYIRALERADTIFDDASNLSSPLDITTTKSGIVCVITKHGAGRQPKPGEIVVLRETGILDNGAVFRRTKAGPEPEFFWLLGDRHSRGLIEALSLLHVGDSATITIPAALARGERPRNGETGTIPADSSLTYVVQIVDVKSRDLTNLMMETAKAKGVDAAVEQFRVFQREGFPDVYADEDQLNGFGYSLLKQGDREGAIKILQLNVSAHPQSANVYDSLGEAFAANGQKDLAIVNYRKALAIDPQLKSSIEALKKLTAN